MFSDVSGEGLVFWGLVLTTSFKYCAAGLLRWLRQTRFVQVGQVSLLLYFPVKSCKPVSLTQADCTRKGLHYDGVTDRHWMVVRENKRFLSQRQEPKMALITASCHGDYLHLDAPGKDTLKLPKNYSGKPRTITCTVWDEPVEGVDCGEEAASWISDFLEMEGLRVVCYIEDLPDRDCTITEKPWVNATVTGDTSAFADWCSYLLATEASLGALNRNLSEPVSILQFRPNILIEGTEAFDEDNWEEVKIGDRVQMRCLDPCTRCVQTTVDLKRGVKSEDGEPLKTLKQMRCFPMYGSSPIFGTNATPDVCGSIRVGDPVYAIRKHQR